MSDTKQRSGHPRHQQEAAKGIIQSLPFTVIALIVVELTDETALRVPGLAILLLAAPLITFRYGLGSGLINLGIVTFYAVYYFSTPGELFRYTDENFRRLVTLSTLSLVLTMIIGVLQRAVRTTTNQLHRQLSFANAITSSLGEGVYALDDHGNVTFVNPAAERLLGWTQAELLGKHMLEVIHCQRTDGVRVPAEEYPLLEVLHSGKTYHTDDDVFTHKDGTMVPVAYTSSPIITEGQVTGAVLAFRDMTERKLAEETLRARARQQAAVAELGQRALAGIDLPMLMDEVVALVARTLGLEYVGVMELLPGGNRLLLRAGVGWKEGVVGYLTLDRANSLAGYTLLSQVPVLVEDLHSETRFDVPQVLYEHGIVSSMSVIIHGQERPFGVLNALTTRRRTFSTDDIHFLQAIANVLATAITRKRAEEERAQLLLREQEARAEAEAAQRRLTFLAQASNVLTASLDYRTTLATLARLALPVLADYCIVDVVEENGQITRIETAHVDPVKEALLREVQRNYPPNPHNPVTRVVQTGEPELAVTIPESAIESMAHDAAQLEILHELGPRSWMVVPLVARGRVLGAISLVVAESGRHYGPAELRLAEDLARRAGLAVDNAHLYQEAQAAIRLRDEFLSIAAHELKTPMTSLLGYTQLLQRRAARAQMVSNRDQHALNVIVDQAERLNKLIETLLDLSRLQRGSFSIEQQPLDLGRLAQRLVEAIQPLLQRHTVQLSCPEEPLIIEGDELHLEQVLHNLLQNATKYSPEGGPIKVRVERRDDYAWLAVSDQGIGIPESARPHLFQPFYRASNVDIRNINGFGIGLYIANEIVTRHGGWIEVISEEGKGSTFTVHLPLPTL